MKKFDNFCLALENLNDVYNYDEPYENVVLTGLVAAALKKVRQAPQGRY